ncbi:antibiotic biosynthesis monooxygenase [Chitinibacter fontanus]|uniref:Antibiotic biosynthesis monooxygenase n=1 Tax=Chitinibacter fontanus TaxID=1737446 RepID=A0A7D5ZI40_9NEIS|nr:antibiotic biosynthesis monooxygenase [Chitinibacter fontanus]QLI82287.1 antibiotic biosynthesis monooxygenase [Chitinibacter fontanus]
MTLAIVSTIVLKANSYHPIKKALKSMDSIIKNEYGCLKFEVHEYGESCPVIVTLEVWKNKDQLRKYLKSDSFFSIKKCLSPHVEDISFKALDCEL